MYSVFGDESHDENRERVFAVAALFGNESDWEGLIRAWSERTMGDEIHAAEIDTPQNKNLYRDLIHILATSNLIGWGVAISLENYDSLFPDAVNQMPYYFCLVRVIEHFADIAAVCLPQDKVKFTFDHNEQVQYNAANLYRCMTQFEEWKNYKCLHDEIFFDSRKSVIIQAADVWAREVMKHMDNAFGPIKRPTRRSFSVLRETSRFAADLYDKHFLQSMKMHIENLTVPGHTKQEYDKWLCAKKRQDTTEHRIGYLVQLGVIKTSVRKG